MRKTKDILFSLAFLSAILLPGIQTVVPVFPDMASSEKRTLATWPDGGLAALDEFPTNFEKYFNDHFGFRNALVHFYNLALTQSATVSPLPISSNQKVLLGKKGWLFYDWRDDGKSIIDYQGMAPFSDEELEKIRTNLENQRNWLRQRNIALTVAICPSKHTIYPEYLPDTVQRDPAAMTRLDQLTEYLGVHSDFRLIDFRPVFWEEKKIYPLYYKSDTHWNNYGAFLAYRQLLQRWEKPALTLSDFKITVSIKCK